MTQKMSLLDAVPNSEGNLEEAALLHAYDQSWQLYARACDLRPVSDMDETWRIDYENSRDREQEDERKKRSLANAAICCRISASSCLKGRTGYSTPLLEPDLPEKPPGVSLCS